MDNVAYLLGAGFSAPLGLPVMSNFLEKSKDLYLKEPEKFKYFQNVFDTIDKMSKCKNYYSTDLFNIEEILSILEMQERLSNSDFESSFLKYIVDVVNILYTQYTKF